MNMSTTQPTQPPLERTMLPPALVIEDYYVDELQFTNQPKYVELADKEHSIHENDLDIRVSQLRHPQDERRWAFRLMVKNMEESVEKLPYSFQITMVGYFVVAENFPAEHLNRMIATNAPSILYSSAREILAMVTGRGPHGAIRLPTVSFATVSKSEPTAASKDLEATKSKKTVAKTRAKSKKD